MNTKLRIKREQAKKTQAQLAREVKISLSQYQNIEYNKNEPKVRTAIRIAKALGTTAEEIFTEKERE